MVFKSKLLKANNNGWAAERQAQAIQRWQAWNQTPKGKAVVAQNVFKGGVWAELMMLKKQTNALLREQGS
jgi:hypothetical protein